MEKDMKERSQDKQGSSAELQPVVSSDGSVEDQKDDDKNNNDETEATSTDQTELAKRMKDQGPRKSQSGNSSGYSRLFAPYRSLGIVSLNGAFHLLQHQNSANAMACVAIGERFHLLQCDKLHPVLVSHAVPAGSETILTTSSSTSSRVTVKKSTSRTRTPRGPHEISHLVSDSSMSVSLVAHGPPKRSEHVSLYQRTRPVATLKVTPPSTSNTAARDDKEWMICELLHLGRIKVTIDEGEKQGSKENALLCAVILSRAKSDAEIDHDRGVPIVGDNDDDDSSDSNSSYSDDDDSSEEEEEDSNVHNVNDKKQSSHECYGQVVMVVATRTALFLHNRIPLTSAPSFCPRVAIHPSTYVNKILLGGSSHTNDNNEKSNRRSDALILLNVKTGRLIHIFTCLTPPISIGPNKTASSEITTLEQSPAVDTIAVGTSRGMVHLINARLDRLLFSLRHKTRKGKNKGKPVGIASISFRTDGSALQYGIAPMAVGRSDGNITVWDLTPPEQGHDSDEEAEKRITAPMSRTILCEMEQVHYPGGIAKLQYFPGEPLLLSTGTHSNAVLMHVFDSPDHSGRLLRSRKGHTSPPKHIRYLHPGAGAGGGVLVNAADGTDAAACQILSSGSSDRSMRLFSTVRTVLDKEYSQGRGLAKKAKQFGMKSKTDLLLPPLIAMATSEVRSRDWGDLVTIHQDHAFAYVWSSKRGAQAGPVLRQEHWNVSAMKLPPPIEAHATSITLSTCGNYALVGTRGGYIYRYNVQSGNSRGTYPMTEQGVDVDQRKRLEAGNVQRTVKALEKKMKISNRASNLDKLDVDVVEKAKAEQRIAAKLRLASHVGFAVTGVAVDAVNKTVISVGSDAKLILWNFMTHAPHKRSPCKLPMAATKLCYVRDSDLASIALEDYSVLLFDCSNLTTVRRFGVAGNESICHSGPISDLGMAPDGRTLYTSSLDGTLRVWDIPTNTCIDWLGFSTPPTSLTVSPTGEFLATTHAGKLGISLWGDRSFYETVHVDGAQAPLSPARMDDPVPISESEDKSEEDQDDSKHEPPGLLSYSRGRSGDTEDKSDEGPAVAKEAGLITLSGLPPAHWKNLFHLELVRQRNKPIEAPKKPPTAPFFLQWRGAETLGGEPAGNGGGKDTNQDDPAEWDAVWSDDDDANQSNRTPGNPPLEAGAIKRSRDSPEGAENVELKRRKVSHHRSHLASLLEECAARSSSGDRGRFQVVTNHIASLGPSAIDVSLSSLCSGMHDLEDGLPLLNLACEWLLEACDSRERYDAVNAYLHRFLYLHANVIAGIDNYLKNEKEQVVDNLDDDDDDGIARHDRQTGQRNALMTSLTLLRKSQRTSSQALQSRMEHTLCLLRHFSRMV